MVGLLETWTLFTALQCQTFTSIYIYNCYRQRAVFQNLNYLYTAKFFSHQTLYLNAPRINLWSHNFYIRNICNQDIMKHIHSVLLQEFSSTLSFMFSSEYPFVGSPYLCRFWRNIKICLCSEVIQRFSFEFRGVCQKGDSIYFIIYFKTYCIFSQSMLHSVNWKSQYL